MNRIYKKETGKFLNIQWQVHARHALYREDGKWYHHLKYFPGAFFDINGYVLFATERDYNTGVQKKPNTGCPPLL